MNRLHSGGIAVGMATSKARFDNSKVLCHACIKEHTKNDKTALIVKTASQGYCDCCEEFKTQLAERAYPQE